MTIDQTIMLSKILPYIPQGLNDLATCNGSWCKECQSILPKKPSFSNTCIAPIIQKYPLIRTNFYKHHPEFNI